MALQELRFVSLNDAEMRKSKLASMVVKNEISEMDKSDFMQILALVMGEVTLVFVDWKVLIQAKYLLFTSDVFTTKYKEEQYIL